MTTVGALFCLERLAWDHGMRVIYRGIHRNLSGGRTEHLLESSGSARALVRNPLSSRGGWPAQIASLMTGSPNPLPGSASQPGPDGGFTDRTRHRPAEGHEGIVLASWLLVPRARCVWRSESGITAS